MSSTSAGVGFHQKPPKGPSLLRGRILAVAQDLFYRHGIHKIGVDAIAAAAGSNKVTLYRHFPSKDALIAESIRARAQDFESAWHRFADEFQGDPYNQLMAWLTYLADFLTGEEGRGCLLANAAIEIADRSHPLRELVEQRKRWQWEVLVGLCTEGGFVDPTDLASKIFLLFEGARICIQSLGLDGPVASFRSLLKTVVDSHAGGRVRE
jgi:AcrR family transcriptional regulator